VLPLAKPGLAVSAIFTAMNCWNEFLFALNLTSVKAMTLPVMAANFVTQEAILWGPVTATGTMLTNLPEWPLIHEFITDAITAALAGEKTTEAALEEADKNIANLLETRGYYN
jgi:ABC-type glycerol-3-phosphate transport system permease component